MLVFQYVMYWVLLQLSKIFLNCKKYKFWTTKLIKPIYFKDIDIYKNISQDKLNDATFEVNNMLAFNDIESINKTHTKYTKNILKIS